MFKVDVKNVTEEEWNGRRGTHLGFGVLISCRLSLSETELVPSHYTVLEGLRKVSSLVFGQNSF